MRRELRFVTFNSIINDNLMPWLAENQDPEKFRHILRKMAPVQPEAAGPFFGALMSAYRDMGISAGQKLIDEWEMLSRIPEHPEISGSISPFMQMSDDNPKLLFYTSIIAQGVAACFSLIANLVFESHSETLRKHRIMLLMKTIADMIIRTRSLNPTAAIDRAIINRLLAALAVLFAETRNCYPDTVELSILRVSSADIKNILLGTANSDENTQILFRTLAGRYSPIADEQPAIPSPLAQEDEQKESFPPLTGSANQQIADMDFLREMLKMKEELSGIKTDVAGAVKKMEHRPEIEDQRIGSAEVCALLHISKSTLKAHREKNLYSYTKIGSRYLYSAIEINKKLKFKKQE